MMIQFGREITGDLITALRREWLVTNGIGGYAMGTISGARTRRYHGLLIAAASPPAGRALMLAGLDVWVTIGRARYPLVTHDWAAGVVLPDGYRHLESFRLDGNIPTFTYAVGDVQVVQRIWMQHGRNTTYLTYTYARGRQPIGLELTPLCTHRDHHGITAGGGAGAPSVHELTGGVEVVMAPEALPLRLYANTGEIVLGHEWWWAFQLDQETRRGLSDQEDLFAAATINAALPPGATFCLVATAEQALPPHWKDALQAERDRQAALLETSAAAVGADAPAWVRQLVLAADQFIVDRPIENGVGKSVIGGYPWFSDWGRDTMIALPGLTLATGRPEVTAAVLRTFARFVDQGMLPNRFPGTSDAPDYNTVDATLWYFVALHYYLDAQNDNALAAELYPALVDIIDWHVKGTRYKIKVDPEDHLLYAGEPGVQLTWMDAKIGDWVVTPRIGKPVEINALWYNALRIIASMAARLGRDADAARYEAMARAVQDSFNLRFWCGKYLYDVIDTPDGDDMTLRPNQLMVVALPYALLDYQKAKAVVEVCACSLVTSMGVRTLDPAASGYVGQHAGSPRQRDSAYHQGTVWSWLIGPFVSAHYKVYNDAGQAFSYLRPLIDHLSDAGLGTISEVFDGDPPHTPSGAIAQAWSVAEALRVWCELRDGLGAQ
ncbi:MAG: glycogen debranching enzyme family protein [Anaerolineae bacterium]|nr:glycogen debranching enzyme family protein [Anaerolineae bacterium]